MVCFLIKTTLLSMFSFVSADKETGIKLTAWIVHSLDLLFTVSKTKLRGRSIKDSKYHRNKTGIALLCKF